MPNDSDPSTDDRIHLGTLNDAPLEVDADEFDDLQTIADDTGKSLDQVVTELDDASDLLLTCIHIKATLKEWRDNGMQPDHDEVEALYDQFITARNATPDLADDHLYADIATAADTVEACLFNAEHLLYECKTTETTVDPDTRQTVTELLFAAGIALEAVHIPDLEDDQIASGPAPE